MSDTTLDSRSFGHKAVHAITIVLFLVVLTSPWIAGLFGATSESIERRPTVTMPILNRDTVRDASTFAQLNRWFRDATPLRNQSTGWYHGTWLQLGISSDTGVVEGPGDTFFLAEDFSRACLDLFDYQDVVDRFGEFTDAAASGGKEFLFIVAPDKATILDDELSGRAALAAGCGREARPLLQQTLAETGVNLDLVQPLLEAQAAEPGRWYYEHDSHWTFDAGTVAAGHIIDHFEPGLFDPDHVEDLERALPINGDIYGRLGILRSLEVPDPFQGSIRPGIETVFEQTPTGGTSPIRSHTSSGDGTLIPGVTIVVRDSMMNYAENQIAAYFEEVHFMHWNDMARVDFMERVAAADRVIMMRVERNTRTTLAEQLLTDGFARNFVNALSTPN